jgi:ribosomal protein S18 acetylase RimI-like enzyme
VGDVRILDSELARRLVIHEARAQQTPTRELRDLGDGWLFHDQSDAEPFWNRLIAPAWPSDPDGFVRRLDEIITLFATLGRLPHVRPLPCGGTPVDLAARLASAGWEVVGADRRMVLVDPSEAATRLAAAQARVTEEFGQGSVAVASRDAATDGADSGTRWADRRRWAVDASVVLADAFGVDADRRLALEHDLLACVSRPGCAVLLVSVDGVPAALARRATTADGSYLSSIGTRRIFRRRGLGALVTAIAVRDALAAGSEMVHLAVEVDNRAAIRLYESLGFAIVGEPTADLLLR